MPRAFYQTESLYESELARIWHGGWLFAGFTFEIAKPGDYLTFSVGGTSVLVMRDDQGGVRAFHNVCRHRGTLLCRADAGHVRAIVCPYHSWTYSRQGDLVNCHGMQEGVDKSKLGLKPLHVEVVAGLIYVSLAASPPDFAPLREEFEPAARPQGFERAKIAKMIEYDVEANWKLVWENNRECFHCVRCHPQYVKANFDIYDEGTGVRSRPREDGRGDRAHAIEVGVAGHRDHAHARRPRDVSRSRARPVVRRGSHGARRRLRDRVDGRPARRAAHGRLPGRRRRRAAHALAAQLLGARELRPRGRGAAAARSIRA